MVWSRTLALLASDVADRCDVDGQAARHPPATVRRRVIESYQRLRDWMTSAGSKRWVVGPVSLSGSDLTWVHPGGYCARVPLGLFDPPNKVLPYERPHLVEAYIDSKWVELKPISVGEIHDYYQQQTRGRPAAWALTGNVNEVEATGDETSVLIGGQFALVICPDFDPVAYPIQFYGQPVINITDADATTLTLDGPGFDWIIWDTVVKIAARDNDSQNTYQVAQIERQKCEDFIRAAIRSELQNVVQRRDVFHGNARYNRTRRL